MITVGIATSTDLVGLEPLYRSKLVVVRDSTTLERFGRGRVVDLSTAQVWTLGGVSVVYGPPSPSLINLARKLSRPVILVVSSAPITGGKSAQVLSRMRLAGKTVIEIVIEDNTAYRVDVQDGAAEVTLLPTLDSQG